MMRLSGKSARFQETFTWRSLGERSLGTCKAWHANPCMHGLYSAIPRGSSPLVSRAQLRPPHQINERWKHAQPPTYRLLSALTATHFRLLFFVLVAIGSQSGLLSDPVAVHCFSHPRHHRYREPYPHPCDTTTQIFWCRYGHWRQCAFPTPSRSIVPRRTCKHGLFTARQLGARRTHDHHHPASRWNDLWSVYIVCGICI